MHSVEDRIVQVDRVKLNCDFCLESASAISMRGNRKFQIATFFYKYRGLPSLFCMSMLCSSKQQTQRIGLKAKTSHFQIISRLLKNKADAPLSGRINMAASNIHWGIANLLRVNQWLNFIKITHHISNRANESINKFVLNDIFV